MLNLFVETVHKTALQWFLFNCSSFERWPNGKGPGVWAGSLRVRIMPRAVDLSTWKPSGCTGPISESDVPLFHY